MGAKAYLALAMIALAASGCETARRLAPPGFFKYEDIAGDQPVNPAIEERIAARRSETRERFPRLSAQPNEKPEGLDGVERAILQADLTARRDELETQTADDQARAEKARLEKSVAKLDKEIKGLAGRVNNPKFAASAPAEVVEEARANLEARNEEREKLTQGLARLAEMS